MRRREFIILLASATACPVAAHAQQQAGKVPRIGYLRVTSPSDRPPLLDAFRQGLRELRWVEGQNIVIDYRFAEGRLDRLPDLAAELACLRASTTWWCRGVLCVVDVKRVTSTGAPYQPLRGVPP